MTIYINSIWVKCDHEDDQEYLDCDHDTMISPEAGNGDFFEGGGGLNIKELATELNGEFENSSNGWKAVVERNSRKFKIVKIYCPDHANK